MTQTIIDTPVPELLAKVDQFKKEGFRLVQICATKLPECLELQYSFDKNFEYVSLRVTITDVTTEIPSVSGIYWNAFHYENEMHDLFGVKVKGIAIDYKGAFYKTTIPTPFNPQTPTGEAKA